MRLGIGKSWKPGGGNWLSDALNGDELRRTGGTDMEYIMIALLVIAIGLSFLVGNFMIIDAVCGGDALDWSESWPILLIASLGDIILLVLACIKILSPASASFQLMRNGLKNRKIARKEAANLKKLLEDEKLYVNRYQTLRDTGISEGATKRTLHFCQLIESIVGKEQLQDCLAEVNERQGILDEIDDIEGRMLKIAESCKNAGDTEKCKYYLDILMSANKITPEIRTLERECEEQISLREKERKAIRLWRRIFLCALAILIAVSVVIYIVDTPYRELRSMIKHQSLTAEMCNWKNRNSENSYYDYLTSEKGREFLAAELTKLHKNDDGSKAMWLLCVQPNETIGYALWASPSFIEWIVGYAKNNGIRSTDQEGPDDRQYRVIYSVDGYQLIMDSSDDKEVDFSDIRDFSVSDGDNCTIVYNGRKYGNAVHVIN